ncbi:MAG TPA: hypothetical protein VNJ12_05600 [Candidatus Dormibacteraeota bacterium]|nr:hypothetical protein [Candidatus Dormibacteraeota bacterium]
MKSRFPAFAGKAALAALTLALLVAKPHPALAQTRPVPPALARGRRAIEAAARAAGGSTIAEVKTLRVAETSQVISPSGSITYEETYLIAYPSRIHADLTILKQHLRQVYDGRNGWMASAKAVELLPARLVQNVRRRILVNEGIGIYRAVLRGGESAEWVGEETVESRQFVALEWKSEIGPIRLYIDPQTRMLAGARYTATTDAGSIDTVEIWNDFRPVAGLKLPFHVVTYQRKQKVMDVAVRDIRVNVAPDPKSFAKPKPVRLPRQSSQK